MYNGERSQYLLSQPKTKEVIEELIELNEGLMGKQLNKFGMQGDPDAVSFAYEALYNAIKTFEPSRNNAFSTYATICIFNRLGSYVRTLKTQINMNTSSYDNLQELFLESAATADEDLLQQCGVDLIIKIVRDAYKETSNVTHKAMLKVWIKSSFSITNLEIATQFKCSQSYVNQVINKFRKVIKNKLKESV